MREDASLRVGDRSIGRVILGGARWSIEDPDDDRATETLIEHALHQGLDAIDTARAYTRRNVESHNEELIARVLTRLGARDQVLVATKCGQFREGDRYRIDGSPDALRRDTERSLRALRTERLNLSLLHFPDPQVPLEESVGALESLRRDGLINRIGLANVDLAQLDRAQRIARIDVIQIRHSLDAPASPALIARCAEDGVALLGYSPLGGGRAVALLDPARSPRSAIGRIAAERDAAPATVAIAWLASAGPSVGIITGARRRSSFDSSFAGRMLTLSPAEQAEIAAELALLHAPTTDGTR